MPMYEFQCQRCRADFEELVRSAASLADVKCPACGADEVQRQVSAAAVGGGSGGSVSGASGGSSRGCGTSGFS